MGNARERLRPAPREKATAEAWREAVRGILTPLAKALLARGFGYRELVRLAGEALLRAVKEEGILSDRELAERTGIPAPEVRRLRGGAQGHVTPALPYAIAARLVSRWVNEPEFTENGRPRVLPLYGAGSFARLADMAGADPGTALVELRRAGLVRTVKGGVQLRKDAYVPSSGAVEMLDILGRDGAEFLRVMLHNVEAPPARAMFQRKASYDNIGSMTLKGLRARLHSEAARALRAADRVLAAHDRDRTPAAPGGRRMRVSFGVYVSAEPAAESARRTRRTAGRRKR